jgi:hypothetical protein
MCEISAEICERCVKDGSSRNKIKYPSCSNLGPKINSRRWEWNLELCIMPRCSIEMIEMLIAKQIKCHR